MSEQPDEDQSSTQSTETTTESTTETTSGTTSEDSTQDAGEPGEVADAQLPEDLQPGEDNPLATHPDQTGNADDQIGADREEEPETAPLTREEADYGSGAGSSSGGGSESGSDDGGDGTGDGRVQAQEDDGSDTLDNGGGGAG